MKKIHEVLVMKDLNDIPSIRTLPNLILSPISVPVRVLPDFPTHHLNKRNSLLNNKTRKLIYLYNSLNPSVVSGPKSERKAKYLFLSFSFL